MMPLFLWLFSFWAASLLGSTQEAHAAACCGGGFAAPSVISSDDKAQLALSSTFSEVVVDDVNSSGVWSQAQNHQQVQTFKVDFAHLLNDRWQTGFSIPFVERTKLGQTFSGLGDIAAALGYEYLPEWEYNPWRPKGIGYLQLTAPTGGKNRFESEHGGLDTRGNGFWTLGLGTILNKAWGTWDGFFSFDLHHSFSKSVSSSQAEGTLDPGYGGNLGLGAGYNTQDWRFGSSLTWTYEDPVFLRESANAVKQVERFATAVLSASYLASDEWAATFSYSDQTLFGNPVNTSLGKSGTLLVLRKWGR